MIQGHCASNRSCYLRQKRQLEIMKFAGKLKEIKNSDLKRGNRGTKRQMSHVLSQIHSLAFNVDICALMWSGC